MEKETAEALLAIVQEVLTGWERSALNSISRTADYIAQGSGDAPEVAGLYRSIVGGVWDILDGFADLERLFLKAAEPEKVPDPEPGGVGEISTE